MDACQSSINYSSRGVLDLENTPNTFYNYSYVFSSADYDEDALSDKALQHGVWSKYLLEALQGEETALVNGKLTSNSLQNFSICAV